MGAKQLKVDVNDLTIGMFVAGLDRPWAQTPFPLNGFYIRDAEEIRLLKTYCRYVYIDMVKGSGRVAVQLKNIAHEAVQRAPRVSRTSKARIEVAPLKIRRGVYSLEVPLKTEFLFARRLHDTLLLILADVLQQLSSGHIVPTRELHRLAGEMVGSVLRNPDAFTWLCRIRELNQHLLSHPLRAAVWAISFGRHMGLVKKELDTLALGMLLKDVGKARLDPALLNNLQRTAAEERQYEQFVELSAEILRRTPDVEPRVIAVVKSHCERVNGSGFPLQLKGDRIPLLGKIAAIVTFYDEIIHPHGELSPMRPSKAVAQLYESRDKEFQEELVVEFIRAIGLYPTGTLVELNSGEVAVVVEQNFERRLKPKVVVVMDAHKNNLAHTVFIDLAADDREKQALVDSGKKHLLEVAKIEIVQDLEPGSYGIDIAQVRDNYLSAETKRKSLFSFLKK
ncbi:DUF3391 domain-containing protein [Pseudomaricurvus alcaniphilus]|uniref:HD-GYP domain-containing protein n=1 Tax=Pseudomaricurvus alcaniphilus TaxID=1166482 RepID=UPI0014092DE0|nr:HD-GYP domain-containing protein [Pseudomaricurvus alcaniphilus]NHN38546.1 DUF3391 domain-containing protein [Pseudomaricurvus alcaniphilus]